MYGLDQNKIDVKEFKENIVEQLAKLPEKPGVYIMKDINDNVIYVGKSVSIKDRVRQYFNYSEEPKKKALVSKIHSIEYIITDSEMEALILECNLIKKYMPRYNVLLKDDKNYPYIKVTINEDFPRIYITRKIQKDGARYFGPYTNGGAVKDTIEVIKKVFPIRNCKKYIDPGRKKIKPCLNYHIKLCNAPCSGLISKDEYRKIIDELLDFLSGKQEKILFDLEYKMNQAAENMDFETAAVIRDKIFSIKHIMQKQKVLSITDKDQDVIGFAKKNLSWCVVVFFVRDGKLLGKENYFFDEKLDSDEEEILSAFIKQYYSFEKEIPKEILLIREIPDADIIERWLTDKKGTKVLVKNPKKGINSRFLEMVQKNAEAMLNDSLSRDRKSRIDLALEDLSKLLNINKKIKRIEAFDISNFANDDITASMVVFESGDMKKKDYRRFKIRASLKQDDYAAMHEALSRRLIKLKGTILESEKSDNKSEDSFASIPDLILIDGGLGHLNAVKRIVEEYQYDICIAGMVKDNKHRTRGLVLENGTEIDLTENMEVLRLITEIQNEAHRFALSYTSKLMKKRNIKSVLDEIEGIGNKKKKILLKHFGSINAIKNASIKELYKISGITRKDADNIYNYFKC